MLFEIGDRLREERERLGLSQVALADACGVTMRSLRNYEKNDRQPDASFLASLASTGADVLYILTGQRSAAAPPAPPLKPEEAALLDNYRHSPEEQQRLLRATSAAFAQHPRKGKRSA